MLVVLPGCESISIHALLAERDLVDALGNNAAAKFQSTRSLRSATAQAPAFRPAYLHFNPRAPCGARHQRGRGGYRHGHFNPRAPCGARREFDTMIGEIIGNFNPRAPCGARLCRVEVAEARHGFQSTRSLRSATCRSLPQTRRRGISIHALLAERDRTGLPCRTRNTISIHALLAERDLDTSRAADVLCISIHALLAERDARCWSSHTWATTFQSTRSLRSATAKTPKLIVRFA